VSDEPIEVMFSAAEIAARVSQLAEEIVDRLGPDFIVIAVLKGSFIFTADLIRAMYHCGARPEIDFMTLSSYGSGQESSGNVEVLRDLTSDVTGKKVLLVDDILESGRTLHFARRLVLERGAEQAEITVLLEKPGKRKAEIDAGFVGFRTPDRFVVGYGLDYAHRFRELPFIGVLTAME
jgi:hypoxanthine phosphoribosyltransferase